MSSSSPQVKPLQPPAVQTSPTTQVTQARPLYTPSNPPSSPYQFSQPMKYMPPKDNSEMSGMIGLAAIAFIIALVACGAYLYTYFAYEKLQGDVSLLAATSISTGASSLTAALATGLPIISIPTQESTGAAAALENTMITLQITIPDNIAYPAIIQSIVLQQKSTSNSFSGYPFSYVDREIQVVVPFNLGVVVLDATTQLYTVNSEDWSASMLYSYTPASAAVI